jgi:hypothetical protein
MGGTNGGFATFTESPNPDVPPSLRSRSSGRTIIDATIIAAPSSTKNAAGRTPSLTDAHVRVRIDATLTLAVPVG